MIDMLKNLLLESFDTKEEEINLYCICESKFYKDFHTLLENEWKLKHKSLFKDENLAVSFNKISPYLIDITSNPKQLNLLLEEYGNNSCVFFYSKLNFKSMLKQTQAMFEVCNTNKSLGYFKYYIPSNLNEIFKKPTQKQSQYLFTNIIEYYMEDDLEPNKLNKYTYKDNQIQKQIITLKD
ncbi:DUF4123 domain-containing protein [Arcobacter sp. FWKO B]|uniref:DUF4123 domain-containing protein n=1 Tax=Arcobacter sp. FWKO B TaxID=2593672 RepID=UPI0018A649D9|nr:DUF4123 domain-containing protein [Arcobacter sp. FWKO B]QOG13214.1 DUF4123 domain-containing protein [Arcobacter sp. FWKO B]